MPECLRLNVPRWLAGFFSLAAICKTAFATDATDYSLEQLLQTKFIPAQKIAQQISDAPSAVSVVNAQDIEDFGYRNLAEILNSMRGLTISLSNNYYTLGGRGYGIPDDYAGRIQLIIDGIPINDNFWDQIFFGEEGLLDVNLIKQVEYAPGPGSTAYGNNALLGSIKITTKDGQHIDGLKLSLDSSLTEKKRAQVTYGKKFANSADVLFSASTYSDKGFSGKLKDYKMDEYFGTSAFDEDKIDPLISNKNKRFFVEANYKSWSVQSAYVERTTTTNEFFTVLTEYNDSYNNPFISMPLDENDIREFFIEQDSIETVEDRSHHFKVSYDGDFNENWTPSFSVYTGSYDFKFTSDFDDFFNYTSSSRWWGARANIAFTSIPNRTVVVGAEHKHNYQLAIKDFAFDLNEPSTISSIFIQDAHRINNYLTIISGLRWDSSSEYGSATSPRIAFNISPHEHWMVKLSHGRAFRFKNLSEKTDEMYQQELGEDVDIRPNKETALISELVLEYKPYDNFKVTTSLYRNKLTNALSTEYSQLSTYGREIEIDWASNQSGWRARLSYAKQETSGDYFFDHLANAPSEVYYLGLVKRFWDNRLNVGFDAKHIGERTLFLEDEIIDSSTVANLNISSKSLLPNFTISLRGKDLLNDTPRDRIKYGLGLPDDQQDWQLKMEYLLK